MNTEKNNEILVAVVSAIQAGTIDEDLIIASGELDLEWRESQPGQIQTLLNIIAGMPWPTEGWLQEADRHLLKQQVEHMNAGILEQLRNTDW